MQTSTMKAAFKLPSAAFLMQIYEIFLFSASFGAFSFVNSSLKFEYMATRP